jgi:hypothetical protein
MTRDRKPVAIHSRDYWFKPVENHQTNWALVDSAVAGAGCTAYFFHELSGVFDRLHFESPDTARAELQCNGFSRLAEAHAADWIPPKPPFYEDRHPKGPIYSSGRFWRRLST